jgi:hydroxymethylbilane synthase
VSRLILGTRGSPLARWQADWVREALARALPDLPAEIRVIRTAGDREASLPLDALPGKGFFVKEIEEALLERRIDLAVHSVKDLPSELPGGLVLGAVPVRDDPRDVLCSQDGADLDGLPEGARVGTGSPRRAAQILARRPDLRIEPIRGNVDTRVRRLREGRVDALVLAAAGLRRLGIDVPHVPLPPEVSLPAVGQGALGIEVRAGDDRVRAAVARIDDPATAAAVRAERRFLAALGGGCRVPIAALAEVAGDRLRLRGAVASPDGSRLLRREVEGAAAAPEAAGEALARRCLADGAAAILAAEVRP